MMHLAKEHAEKAVKDFDWESLPKSKTYRDRTHRRNLNKKQLHKEMARVRREVEDQATAEFQLFEQSDVVGIRREVPLTDNWKDDLGEYSRRIWEWWLLRWLKVETFDYFGQAIRKVVLWQLSSAKVERDFSQYAAIVSVCGSNLKQPMLQNRMYARCNKEDYERADKLEVEALLAQLDDNGN